MELAEIDCVGLLVAVGHMGQLALIACIAERDRVGARVGRPLADGDGVAGGIVGGRPRRIRGEVQGGGVDRGLHLQQVNRIGVGGTGGHMGQLALVAGTAERHRVFSHVDGVAPQRQGVAGANGACVIAAIGGAVGGEIGIFARRNGVDRRAHLGEVHRVCVGGAGGQVDQLALAARRTDRERIAPGVRGACTDRNGVLGTGRDTGPLADRNRAQAGGRCSLADRNSVGVHSLATSANGKSIRGGAAGIIADRKGVGGGAVGTPADSKAVLLLRLGVVAQSNRSLPAAQGGTPNGNTTNRA